MHVVSKLKPLCRPILAHDCLLPRVVVIRLQQASQHGGFQDRNAGHTTSTSPLAQGFDFSKLVEKAKGNANVLSQVAAARFKSALENPEFRAFVEKSRNSAQDYANKSRALATSYAVKTKDTVAEEYREFSANLASINVEEMKQQVKASPREYFLYGSLVISPIVVPAAAFLGMWQFYPGLAEMQLIWSGVLVTYFAGMRFGLSLVDVGFPNKQTLLHCGLPMAFCWGSMAMPLSSAYVGAMAGLFSTVYFDHISTVYPETFHALRVFFTLVALASLLAGFLSSVGLTKRVRASVGTPALS